ncbi:hypothetical protein CEXT_367901 [Caerostris extrusa]|uniref:Uncharacterized protein n=1 Tax=Caerostris extrusa TaxID=172846 RepID=A0AAV4M5C0_CAEEX|nr:hypothetical protein CEXT_367901 [Caerostris extrusa]
MSIIATHHCSHPSGPHKLPHPLILTVAPSPWGKSPGIRFIRADYSRSDSLGTDALLFELTDQLLTFPRMLSAFCS